ncbi:ferrochelatase [Luteimonas sp. A478]
MTNQAHPSQSAAAAAQTAPSRGHDALLLVNLGTPDAPTAGAVRRYLGEFLSDRRVVQLTRWLWYPILYLIVLPFRSPRVAKLYAGIWMDEGSPLAVYTRRLAEAVAVSMPDVRVDWAMRYQKPSLTRAIERLRAQGARRILVLPLYPQYSTTTTASVEDVANRVGGDAVRVVHDYHDDPQWVQAVADSIRDYREQHGKGERLLFSYHGIPQRLVDQGDPYHRHCEAGTGAIAAALDLPEGEAIMTFQSRFGREQWLQPYTAGTIEQLARDGVKRIDVVCPGFAVDCLETLEEISIENAELFREHGGEELHYVPCLNDSPVHAGVLADLARRELAAWA